MPFPQVTITYGRAVRGVAPRPGEMQSYTVVHHPDPDVQATLRIRCPLRGWVGEGETVFDFTAHQGTWTIRGGAIEFEALLSANPQITIPPIAFHYLDPDLRRPEGSDPGNWLVEDHFVIMKASV